MAKNPIIPVCIDRHTLELIDQVKVLRGDGYRSSTMRFLILKGLASMSYLPPEQKKALEVRGEAT